MGEAYSGETQGQRVIFRYKGISDNSGEYLEPLANNIRRQMNVSMPIGCPIVIDRDEGVYEFKFLRINDDYVSFNFYDAGANGQDKSLSRLEKIASRLGFEIEVAEA